MRVSMIGVAAGLGAMLLAGAALAQQGPTAGPAANNFGSPIRSGAIPSVTDASFKQSLTNAAIQNKSGDVDLANRLSVLIEAGKCGEARQLAEHEKNMVMAVKVGQLCHR